ncbi:MAG: flagellar hook-basal body complex protein FliE [Candidatus Wallbacteria bacterium HGW-Wallbacteria-1]|uniref:Flagellar hook-basal body complex protein FliE n=1 Tax=Candidatus Wallbacteria bacterium HGW-Wallbacteria-1 TaxID=2013854 RepID=A0A2N1PTA2_9BACT|nr:MAG: flagellar hook-basal body complex protein FliE [Candidatus Wallbacteria bacterium HGW-Wallbacteria-1]
MTLPRMIRGPESGSGSGSCSNEVSGQGFMEMLKGAIDKVNDDQIESREMSNKLITGQVENVHDVMIASEKAKLSMQFTMEVRNKIMAAYKEITRMQV